MLFSKEFKYLYKIKINVRYTQIIKHFHRFLILVFYNKYYIDILNILFCKHFFII